ncbi:hypothetical protein pb186bvf_004737 [Paramecium bursaria]
MIKYIYLKKIILFLFLFFSYFILKEIKEYQEPTHEFNQLQKAIPYNPIYHNFIQKYQLKDSMFTLKSEEFIPGLMIGEKLQNKIQLHKTPKEAFGLTNIIFDTNIQIDDLSYDIADGYQEKLERDNLYSIYLNFQVEQNHNTLNKLCEFLQSTGTAQTLDLMFLNLFRISLFAHQQSITTFIYYPSVQFKLQQIKQSNKFVETPLTRMITKSRSQSSQKKDRVQYKYGFLTLDQSNRILPLMAEDPLFLQVPLIGAWIYSNDQYDDPQNKRWLVWAILTEYLTCKQIKQRISKDNFDKFLYIQFQKNQSPMFYEVSLLEEPSYKILRWQDKIINFDNYLIDLGGAQPFNQIERISDLLSPTIIDPSFQQDSCYKQPPIPTPILRDYIDGNSSMQSAHFAIQHKQFDEDSKQEQKIEKKQKDSKKKQLEQSPKETMAEKLVLIQSEQLKIMQNQILDLQRALIQSQQIQQQMHYPSHSMVFPNQYHVPPQYMSFTPMDNRLSHTQFYKKVESPAPNQKTPEQNQFNQLPIHKIDFLSEQMKLKTQSKKKEVEIDDMISSFVCDSKSEQNGKPQQPFQQNQEQFNRIESIQHSRQSCALIQPSIDKQNSNQSDKQQKQGKYESPAIMHKRSTLGQLMMSSRDATDRNSSKEKLLQQLEIKSNIIQRQKEKKKTSNLFIFNVVEKITQTLLINLVYWIKVVDLSYCQKQNLISRIVNRIQTLRKRSRNQK